MNEKKIMQLLIARLIHITIYDYYNIHADTCIKAMEFMVDFLSGSSLSNLYYLRKLNLCIRVILVKRRSQINKQMVLQS